ncbi:MAG: bifunctional diaminohydroxyphosphoribosylaminopyrimidine deaminase/5-amino-6-(5-phosphoribosylamino)uracil reductase RibD [Crocinitomicaceae bacterium]
MISLSLAHEDFMARCIHLAKLGIGKVAPNPMVGSVVVHNNKIIGEGYHEQYGEAHAEVNAINSVQDKSVLSDSIIYVNLEPCAHFGKTPPCADLIIEKGIKTAVIGCIDPFSKVAGRGIEKLKAEGVKVIVNILQNECIALNRRFFTFHELKRPYIILKWAQSANAMIDINRESESDGIHWITQPETKSLVHQWRAEESAILVGRKTVQNDNPSLTCRHYYGTNPIRIVIDKNAKLDINRYKISNDEALAYIFTEKPLGVQKNTKYITLEPFNLKGMLSKLFELNIQSIIIEGGKITLEQFIKDNIWDEARVLTGINSIENGSYAPQIKGHLSQEFYFGEDKVSIYQN